MLLRPCTLFVLKTSQNRFGFFIRLVSSFLNLTLPHFWQVSMHFFHIFLSSHLPFFFSFLHFLVEILSLQMGLSLKFSFSEIKTENKLLFICVQNILAILSSCSRHRTTKFTNSESPIFCLLAWSARHSAIYKLKSCNLL